MRLNLEGDASIEPFTADEQGRITLGKEYANDRVRVAVLERIDEGSTVVPSELPRFDYRSVGSSPTVDSRRKRVALVENGSAGDPYWFGTTVADDVEVGITPDEYRRHILITGTVDSDRQAAVRAQYQQALDRDRGALVYDAYAHNYTEDGESPYRLIAREVGREADVIEIDVDDPSSASFNVMELGQEALANPDSHQAAEEIEAIVDQLKHLASAGNTGRDGYWGAEMERAIRNVVQSGVREGLSPTIRDVCEVLSDGERYKADDGTLSEDRQEWLTEARTTVGEGIGRGEWEPVLRRLMPWMEATEVQRAIADPEPTFSVEQAVREGKIILITGESRTEIEKAHIAVAASLRAWDVQQTVQDRGEKPTPFTLFSEGFHKLTNTQLKLADLLSLSRAYEFTIIASAPRIQSFDNPDVIADHTKTHLTFSTSEEQARKAVQYHTQNVTQKGIQQLSSDVAYLRHPSHRVESIKINTLRPTVGRP